MKEQGKQEIISFLKQEISVLQDHLDAARAEGAELRREITRAREPGCGCYNYNYHYHGCCGHVHAPWVQPTVTWNGPLCTRTTVTATSAGYADVYQLSAGGSS
jgi:hypothetical protein